MFEPFSPVHLTGIEPDGRTPSVKSVFSYSYAVFLQYSIEYSR